VPRRPSSPFACQNGAELRDIEQHPGDAEARQDQANSGRARRPQRPCKRTGSGSNPLTGSQKYGRVTPDDGFNQSWLACFACLGVASARRMA
jgi:hypothetical protein